MNPKKEQKQKYEAKSNFPTYRKDALKALWRSLKRYGYAKDWIIRQTTFSTWKVDEICANNWRDEKQIAVCAYELVQYVKDYVL